MDVSVTLNLMNAAFLKVRRASMSFPVDSNTTVGRIIELVDRVNPGFQAAVLHADGSLSNQFVFFIDGTNIHSLGGLQAPLRANQVVNVIPAIAGG